MIRKRILRNILRNKWIYAAMAILAAWPAVVFAQATPTAMDAIEYIFGVTPNGFWGTLTGDITPGVMSSISGVICVIALAAVVIVMVITAITGVLQSAHEGESALGRRYSTLWLPLRWVLAVGLLLPIGGGYSAAQLITLGLGAMGSNFADQAAGLGTSIGLMGEATAIGAQHAPTQRETVNQVFASEVCAARVNKVASEGGGGQRVAASSKLGLASPAPGLLTTFGGVGGTGLLGVVGTVTEVPRDPVYVAQMNWNGCFSESGDCHPPDPGGQTQAGDVVGLCGRMDFERSVEFGQASADMVALTQEQQFQNLHTMQWRANDLADKVVRGTINEAGVRKELAKIEGLYARAEQVRINQLAEAGQSLTSIASQHAADDVGKPGGWITLGAYYMALAGINSAISDIAGVVPKYSAPRLNQMSPALQQDVLPYLSHADRVSALGNMMPTAQETDNYPSSSLAGGDAGQGAGWFDAGKEWVVGAGRQVRDAFSASDGMWDKVKGWINTPFNGWFRTLRDAALTPGVDPIVSLQSIGHSGIVMIEIVFVLVMGAAAFSLTFAPVLFAAAMAVIGPIFLMCVVFAYILPAIPMVLFLFGVMGWCIMLIEAVVSVPLHAAAHALPDGEGWSGSHARAGYMLLMNLLARPILMVVGLFAGILVMRFISMLLGGVFFTFIDIALGPYVKGLVTMVVLSILYCALVVTIARRSFALIHIIPDRAMRWIGGHIESQGENDASRELEQAAMAGAMGVGGMWREGKKYGPPIRPPDPPATKQGAVRRGG